MGVILRVFSRLTKGFDQSPKDEVIKLIYSYRYISLLITSMFYLLSGPKSLLIYKIVTIFSLYIMARIITDLYITNSTSSRVTKALILLETFVITLLLIPTGGLDSPFIWYALNPVLVAAWYLSQGFCWLNLFVYMTSATIVSSTIFKKGNIISLILERSYLMLVFILITLLVQSLAALLKQLQYANERKQESMEHIMSLYQTVETLTAETNPEAFFNTFTNYAAKLTRSELAFFWLNSDLSDEIHTNISIKQDLRDDLIQRIKTKMHTLQGINSISRFNLRERYFYMVPVKSASELYGVLGVEVKDHIQKYDDLLQKQLLFISNLSSMILQRFSLEEINNKLMVLDERNRIANEIHDSVSQRLFSITCGLHTLQTRWNKLSEKDISEQLLLLSDSAAEAKQELRLSIYGLSTQKYGEKILFTSIKSYLQGFGKLNGVNIKVNLKGEEERISSKLKKSLYRIICEATGNAVKHGKSGLIEVSLEISAQVIKLLIEDDGTGFELESLKQENMGLGIMNMKTAVHSFGGNFLLQSGQALGTKIIIKIPGEQINARNQGGVA